jgi:hypothetical protein
MPPRVALAPGSIAKMGVQLLAPDAGFHNAIKVFRVDREDAVHAGEVERDAAAHRAEAALQRGAGAERDDRRAVRPAEVHQVDDIGARLGEHHGIGPHGGDMRLAEAVLLKRRGGSGEARAEAGG